MHRDDKGHITLQHYAALNAGREGYIGRLFSDFRDELYSAHIGEADDGERRATSSLYYMLSDWRRGEGHFMIYVSCLCVRWFREEMTGVSLLESNSGIVHCKE